MDACVQEIQLRHAAFETVSRAAILNGGVLSSDDLAAGFQYQGDPLINPQRGIFKPRQMAALLSIRTVFPRQGSRVWYDDQRSVRPSAL
jgi:putative restriction endonuclease